MTLHPCASCADAQGKIRRLVRQAERRERASLSTNKQIEQIDKEKAYITECADAGHSSMQHGRDATRARHAAGREARGKA